MPSSTIWSRSQSLLVLYVFKTEKEFNEFRSALDLVLNESNIKRIKIIVLIEDKNQEVLRHSLFSYISEEDIHFFTLELKKKAKNELGYHLDIARHTVFDLLLCFGKPTKKVLKWILKIQIQQRIGINSEGLETFNLNLQSTSKLVKEQVFFTKNTLDKIY
jgi:hypothetical protein